MKLFTYYPIIHFIKIFMIIFLLHSVKKTAANLAMIDSAEMDERRTQLQTDTITVRLALHH